MTPLIAVIGSMAMLKRKAIDRFPGDWDLVGDYDDIVSLFKAVGAKGLTPFDNGKKIHARTANRIYEAEITWPKSLSQELFNLICEDKDTIEEYVNDQRLAFASLDVCYMLKMTHRFKKNSPHFRKTMQDIHALRKAGAKIRPEHQDFYERRLKATLDYGHPKLNQSKKDFFTDAVPYKYDHDSIHTVVALQEKPAYNYYKPDENEVYTSRALFEAQPIHVRLLGVYEEACVLALERSQIPHPHMDRRASFNMALEKVCTSITSGWFREFAWEHYDMVQAIYDELTRMDMNYVTMFERGLQNGLVKPYVA